MRGRMKRKDMEFAILYLLLHLQKIYDELAKGGMSKDYAKELSVAVHKIEIRLLGGK